MASIKELRTDWIATRKALALKAVALSPMDEISSASEFATSAWEKRLRAWRVDLDGLLAEYPDLPTSVNDRPKTVSEECPKQYLQVEDVSFLAPDSITARRR